jgi:purine-cytosine permease-like protein
MKKIISTFLFVSLLALVPMTSMGKSAAVPAFESTTAEFYSASTVMRPCTGSKYARFYKRNRNAMNVAIGTGIGTIIGSMVDGKRGALIGMGAGAGGGLLYTYKLNPKTKQCQKVYYRRG